MDTIKVLDELQTSVVKLSFDKGKYINGTLNPEVTPTGWKIKQSPKSDELVVWDTKRRRWKSFRVDTVRKVQYKVGD
tara:strand:+ start:307 stop:537 length:231 start_codon:yes stop_codon:yes gene_type:complete